MSHDTQKTETTTASTLDAGAPGTGSTLDAGKLAGALFGLGATWARYGLAIGRASLTATAATLETTGEMLGRLSKTLEQTAAQVRDRDRARTDQAA